MKKTLVIFDIDGTLVFSNKIDSQCFALTYQQIYQKPFPSIDWRRYPHVTDHTIFNAVIKEHFDRQATAEEITLFQDHFVDMLATARIERPMDFLPVPYARETVERLLADDRFAVGIGTGGWQRPACLKLGHVGIPIEPLFLSAADNQPTREDITNHAIKQASDVYGEFGRIVYVGDAVWDVRTTRNLSMNFIGIRRNGDFDVLKNNGADYVLKDFRDQALFMDAVENAAPPRTVAV